MEWIKCSERLPTGDDNEYKVYFVLKNGKKIYKGYYDDVYDTFESSELHIPATGCVFSINVNRWKLWKD